MFVAPFILIMKLIRLKRSHKLSLSELSSRLCVAQESVVADVDVEFTRWQKR
jgi:hypothetical protein